MKLYYYKNKFKEDNKFFFEHEDGSLKELSSEEEILKYRKFIAQQSSIIKKIVNKNKKRDYKS